MITPALTSDIIVARNEIELESSITYVFDRGYYNFEWWAEINNVGSYFITRLKKHTKPKYLGDHSTPEKGSDILEDHVIQLNQRMKSSRRNPYQKKLRRIITKDGEGNTVQLITNDFESSAQEIGDKYRSRWQIELFFKWIKQNLKIKRFYGLSANAIKTQVYIAMIGFLLMKLMHGVFDFGKAFTSFVKLTAQHLLICHSSW